MVKIILYSLISFITIQNSFSQTENIISGTISSNGSLAKGVYIINLVIEKETISDENGKFEILSKPGDILLFSSANFASLRKTISENEYSSGTITVEMIPKIIELEEVTIIKYDKINAKDLGILSKPAKKYTPAERRLYAASGGISGIINSINGNIQMLKKGIELEKKQIMIDQLSALFSDDFYINHLKIPSDYIRGFQYYAVDDKDLQIMIVSKNQNLIVFKLMQLSATYMNLQQDIECLIK